MEASLVDRLGNDFAFAVERGLGNSRLACGGAWARGWEGDFQPRSRRSPRGRRCPTPVGARAPIAGGPCEPKAATPRETVSLQAGEGGCRSLEGAVVPSGGIEPPRLR